MGIAAAPQQVPVGPSSSIGVVPAAPRDIEDHLSVQAIIRSYQVFVSQNSLVLPRGSYACLNGNKKNCRLSGQYTDLQSLTNN